MRQYELDCHIPTTNTSICHMESAMTESHLYTVKLNNWLQAWSQGQLRNGRLKIQDSNGRQQWSLYFHLGHLIGDAGGVHPRRRWLRQLAQYCPQIQVDPIHLYQEQKYRSDDYEFLAALMSKREILRQQMVSVVQGSVAEVLFDILQQEQWLRDRSLPPLSYTFTPEEKLYTAPLVFLSPDRSWQQAKQAWQKWCQAGLEEFSPNVAPLIWQREELQQQSSPVVYRSLVSMVDGKRTLRDLALRLRQDPILLTQSLLPYIRRGWMKSIEVGDIGEKLEHIIKRGSQSSTAQPKTTSPLIAYIDDSPRDSQLLGRILTQAGYRYISLQDSVLALPMLLEHKPSLIFLDLVMPIANGYEICAQIRRTSVLKDTPAIILTSNDGIIDRVRAKVVRSTEFISKPIEAPKILNVVRKYLEFGD
ncbi:response regulator [Chroococcidiopsidales cyanobacterium LEGE 13417]|nr:response regulator [Chroococcidiopsidales cyanobacterium LEGE 13417]